MFPKAILCAALLLLPVFSLRSWQGDPTTHQVRGVVIDALTEAPLSRAEVEVQGRGGSERTGLDGTFVLESVPSGQQRVFVVLAGYLLPRLADRVLSTSDGIPVLVGPSTPAMTIRLERAPIVTGRVLNERGEPLPAINVLAYHSAYGKTGLSTAVSDGIVRTDDRGVFRFASLPPGTYRLVAMSPTPDLTTEPLRHPTYYPGSDDPQRAGTLIVEKNANLDIGNLVLRTVRGAGVQLRILRPAGQNVRTATHVKIRRRGDLVMDIANIRAGFLPSGTVESRIGELPPGTYDISFLYDSPSVKGCGIVAVLGTREEVVEIGVKSFEVRGRAIESFPSGSSSLPMALSEVILGAPHSAIDDFCRAAFPASGQIQADGSFRVSGAHPGIYELVVSGLPAGTYIQSIRQGQTERPFGEIEVKEDMDEVTVIFGRDPGRLVGTVTDAGGRLVPAAVVAVVPVEETKAHLSTAATANHDGSFNIPAGPGEYLVYAWKELDGAAYRNTNFMSTYTGRGVKVTVRPGVEQKLELRELN